MRHIRISTDPFDRDGYTTLMRVPEDRRAAIRVTLDGKLIPIDDKFRSADMVTGIVELRGPDSPTGGSTWVPMARGRVLIVLPLPIKLMRACL